jgi:uncharacterized protein
MDLMSRRSIRRRAALLTATISVAMAATTLSGCAPSPVEDPADFARDTTAFRAAKDAAFLEPSSPVPAGKRGEFLPLAYFPPSIDYRVPAVLRVENERPTLEMPTSTGQLRMMQRVGTLEFSVKGQPLTLGAFVEAGARSFDRLFVPFTDLTSGTETYPAGRYLDLDRTRTGIYIIDFNRAYNPYCYYNPTYDCPYPPRGNRLTVPIRAGEKLAVTMVPDSSSSEDSE